MFGIRTYQFKVVELAREPGVAARLASAVRFLRPEDVAFYKGRGRYQDILLEFLDECAENLDGIGTGSGGNECSRSQIRRGVVAPDSIELQSCSTSRSTSY